MVEILTNTFAQGIWEGDIFCSLAKKIPHDYDDLLTCVEKYINIEQAQKASQE